MAPALALPRFRLLDLSGHGHDNSELSGKTTVLLVLSGNCPIAQRYGPLLDRLKEEFPQATFVGVVPGAATPPDQRFMVLRDINLGLLRKLKAEMTPEAFLFDASGKLRYQGRIDDRYVDFGKARLQPTREDLRLAIQDLFAGRQVSQPRRRGVGCFIEYGAR
jgi:hypothetical protein